MVGCCENILLVSAIYIYSDTPMHLANYRGIISFVLIISMINLSQVGIIVII